jgi:hypothetical protein
MLLINPFMPYLNHPEPSVTELHEPPPAPAGTIVEPSVTTPMRMGRGKARTAEQDQSDLDKWAASGLSQKDFRTARGYLIQHTRNTRSPTWRHQVLQD